MKIAILMAQADVSDFSRRFPDDGEKFITLLSNERPDWEYSNHMVFQGEFPRDITNYDGFLITGSTASSNDTDAWVQRLQEMVRAIDGAQIPLFGACFGHQLIAKALGGTVVENPGGWRFGVAHSAIATPCKWMAPTNAALPQYAAHCEQVSRLPIGATTYATAKGTPHAGFTKGTHIATTQYHPEMTCSFFDQLVGALAGILPTATIANARAEKDQEVRGDLMARWIVQFFEQSSR